MYYLNHIRSMTECCIKLLYVNMGIVTPHISILAGAGVMSPM